MLETLWHGFVHQLDEAPLHIVLEVGLAVWLVYMLTRPSYKPERPLSEKEKQRLIDEWEPEPLVPPADATTKGHRAGKDEKWAAPSDEFVDMLVEDRNGIKVKLEGREGEVTSFVSYDYLNLTKNEEVIDKAEKCIREFGVGSCGPRGFYGTFDAHVNLEKALSKHFDDRPAILYSDSIACASSVIMAFASKDDLVVADAGIPWTMRKGIGLSRADVMWFAHNDMSDLERILAQVAANDKRNPQPQSRRFIVVEGVSQAYGDVCDIARVVALAKEYRFRVVLDDSAAFGTVGLHGSLGPAGVSIHDVHMYVGLCDESLGAVGAFCVGTPEVVSHQVLAGAGYVFSASSPPFTAVAATEALRLMREEPTRLKMLHERARTLHAVLSNLPEKYFVVHRPRQDDVEAVRKTSDLVPFAHVRVSDRRGLRPNEQQRMLQAMCRYLLDEESLFVQPEYYCDNDVPAPPSVKIVVTVHHTDEQIERLVAGMRRFAEQHWDRLADELIK